MVVIGFSRSWLRRPEVGLRIRQSDWDRLDEEGQSLLRFEQVVPDSEFGPTRGEGWSPTYDSAALEKAEGLPPPPQHDHAWVTVWGGRQAFALLEGCLARDAK